MSEEIHDNGLEQQLVEEIREGDDHAFEILFFKYYYQLCNFALKITKCSDLASDVVQEVFLKIWNSREDWEIHYSVRAYLYQAVRNQAINQFEKRKNGRRLKEIIRETQKLRKTEFNVDEPDEYEERLIKDIWNLVSQMPERRRRVFELHRRHGLSYKEIASVMNITRKTVENHMGIALQFIRDHINIARHR